MWIVSDKANFDEFKDDLEAAKRALVSRKEQTWRLRMDDLGQTRGTLLLTKVLGDSLRGGKTPKAAASITSDSVSTSSELVASSKTRTSGL